MNQDTTFPKLCDADSSCLVVVDMQDKITAAMPHKVVHRMERNITMLMEAANDLNIPTVATLQYPQGLGQMLPSVKEKLPQSATTVEKTRFSCCGVPEFDKFIKAANRPQVVLAGIELHICVTQTAIDLQAAGYQPWVVVDAAGSRQRDSYDYSMMRLRSCGICLTETEAVLFEWLRDASHPKFKDVSARLTSN